MAYESDITFKIAFNHGANFFLLMVGRTTSCKDPAESWTPDLPAPKQMHTPPVIQLVKTLA